VEVGNLERGINGIEAEEILAVHEAVERLTALDPR
jgi:hypothetical protein